VVVVGLELLTTSGLWHEAYYPKFAHVCCFSIDCKVRIREAQSLRAPAALFRC
jgi:hypothetical protein